MKKGKKKEWLVTKETDKYMDKQIYLLKTETENKAIIFKMEG